MNQTPVPDLRLDPGPLGHPTDTGEPDPETEGSGPFNERSPIKTEMFREIQYLNLAGEAVIRLADDPNPDDTPPTGGGEGDNTPPPMDLAPDGQDPPTQGENITIRDDGTAHITIYDSEENVRISADIDENGNHSDVHITDQNIPKGGDGRH